MGKLEKWLDRRTPLEDGERELSERARNRVFRGSKGPVAVPRGSITMNREGAEHGRVRPYSVSGINPTNPNEITLMKTSEIEGVAEVVDAKILGPEGHQYDSIFEELRQPGAIQRYEQIARAARSNKRLTGLAGAVALGLIAAAVHLPMPRLVGENNCYDHVNPGDYIQPADSVSPQAAADLAQCELGGQQYVIRHTESR